MKKAAILFFIFFTFFNLFSQKNYLPIKVGDKFGISDLQKNIVIEPQYSFVKLKLSRDKVYFIAEKFVNETNTLKSYLLDDKILISDVENASFSHEGSLIIVTLDQEVDYFYLKELYSVTGKRINKNTYKRVRLLVSTKKQELYYLEDVHNQNKIAIYDIEKQEFVKIVIDDLKYFNDYCSSDSSQNIYNLISNRTEYFFVANINNGIIETDLIKMATIDSNDERIKKTILEEPYNITHTLSDDWGEIKKKIEKNFRESYPKIKNFEIMQPFEINYLNWGYFIAPGDHLEKEKSTDSWLSGLALIKTNNQVGLFNSKSKKWLVLPEYDEIYLSRKVYQIQIILKKEGKYSNKAIHRDDLSNISTLNLDSQTSFKDIPLQFQHNYLSEKQHYIEKVLFMYHPETLKFSHYALTDGTEFIKPKE